MFFKAELSKKYREVIFEMYPQILDPDFDPKKKKQKVCCNFLLLFYIII